MESFDYALGILWPEEGGRANDPNDHGGLTMMGVTQRTYDAWRDMQKLPRQSVELLQKPEATNLYHTMFWLPAHCADLPKRLGCLQFDTSVNSGDGEATILLQRALGIDADGKWGPATATAVQFPDSVAEDGAIAAYGAVRKDFMDSLAQRDPTQAKWINGWHNRVDKLVARLLAAEAE